MGIIIQTITQLFLINSGQLWRQLSSAEPSGVMISESGEERRGEERRERGRVVVRGAKALFVVSV